MAIDGLHMVEHQPSIHLRLRYTESDLKLAKNTYSAELACYYELGNTMGLS